MLLCGLEQTLRRPITLEGHGVHSGEPVTIELIPAPERHGIVFERSDLSLSHCSIPARYDCVSATQLGTSISNDAGVTVHTIEHLMAALWGSGIDNLVVRLNGPEVPIMDGSAFPFIHAIQKAGIFTQSSSRRVLELLEPIHVGHETSWISMAPSEHFSVDVTIIFESRHIGRQQSRYHAQDSSFIEHVASARTFGLLDEVNYLRSKGFAKGGSLDNAIVVSEEDGILNKEGLRYNDEFVRHKILDCVGDVFLAGMRMKATIQGMCSGHQVNNQLLHALFESPDSWRMTQ